jgi:Zn-dependent protease with chaperone function
MKHHRKDVGSFSSFKALFIADPDRAEADAMAISQAGARMADQRLVEEVLRRKITLLDRLSELFSTHPNIVKRLRALQKLA